jgi:Fe-S-cluster containining protein
MLFPAIAKQTYEKLRGLPAFSEITQFVIEHLKKITSPKERARFVHNVVDEYNREIFAHPIVQQFLPCKSGCSGCCHTQVGVTSDEAELLAERINDGIKIDHNLLEIQLNAGNNPAGFYQLEYENRRCIFLGTDDSCRVYSDRPSVCRTNAVLGDASQCIPKEGSEEGSAIRLVKTEQSDMAIMGSFLMSSESGNIAQMVGKILKKNHSLSPLKISKAPKKSVFKDITL